jgi:glutamate dehydrogenase
MTAEIATNPRQQTRPATEDDLALDRVHAAEALLPADADKTGLAPFFAALYRGAPPEDITRYSAESLSAIAELAFQNTVSRKPRETLVQVLAFAANNNGGARQETLLIAANDDRPFLFDSLVAALSAQGIRIQALFHPILTVRRDAEGRRSESGQQSRESIIVLALDALPNAEQREALALTAKRVFAQVKLAVDHWHHMVRRLDEAIAALGKHPPHVNPETVTESIAFLKWLKENHFTFLGARDYTYSAADGGTLDPVPDSGLGLLSDVDTRIVRRGEQRGDLSAEIRGFLADPEPLIITKSNERTVVHRRVHMDYIGVKMYDASGKVTGERRFVGLFTSGAYGRRPSDIPLLRLKIARVLERAGFPRDSHDGKALAHILDSFPRDEFFQVSEEELFETALGILRLGERPKVKVFVRCDRFDRFVSLLVFVPRDRYDTAAREKIHAILARAFHGRMSASYPTIEDSVLARVHYIVGREQGQRPKVDVRALETEIATAIRTWEDEFAAALAKSYGEAEGARVVARQRNAFSPQYRDAFAPAEAVRDLAELEQLIESRRGVIARAYRVADDPHTCVRFKIYVLGEVLPLSSSLPVLENLGFRVISENSYSVTPHNGEGWKGEAAILDFEMERTDGAPADLSDIKDRLE